MQLGKEEICENFYVDKLDTPKHKQTAWARGSEGEKKPSGKSNTERRGGSVATEEPIATDVGLAQGHRPGSAFGRVCTDEGVCKLKDCRKQPGT